MLDVWSVAYGSIEDGALEFSRRPAAPYRASAADDLALPKQVAG
jgi:hypothetical protein